MKTVIIQIGNSDDKLTQRGWSFYCSEMWNLVNKHADQVHFAGFSQGDAPWQNACWVLVATQENIAELVREVKNLRELHNQESVAWTEGETEFI